jgi:hypothetical protein
VSLPVLSIAGLAFGVMLSKNINQKHNGVIIKRINYRKVGLPAFQ